MNRFAKSAIFVSLCLFVLGCFGGTAEVKRVVSSPSGSLHAALLFRYGGPTVGTRTYVAIFRGAAPEIGSIHQVSDLCEVFTAYRAGPQEIIWEGETQIALPVRGPLSKDYEEMIELSNCREVKARWFYQEPEPERK
jgi:hypothetical protein